MRILKDKVNYQQKDGQSFIITDSNKVLKIEGIAKEIWEKLMDHDEIDPDELMNFFKTKFPLHHKELERDIPVFLEVLIQHQLVEKE